MNTASETKSLAPPVGATLGGVAGPELGSLGEPRPCELVSIDPIYFTDGYPREGCTVVINIQKRGYAWRVYHPAVPVIPAGQALESYAPRPIGSLGSMLDGWVRILPQAEIKRRRDQAECDYAVQSAGTVIL